MQERSGDRLPARYPYPRSPTPCGSTRWARDGLQAEKTLVPTDAKIALIDRLAAAGLRTIEANQLRVPAVGIAAR